MRTLLLLGLALLGAYLGLIGLMYAGQRALLYFPDPQRHRPAAVGLPQAQEVALASADGERILVWHVPAREGRPVVLYFQGNAGGLALRVARFRRLIADGTGLVALNYRGYGGSSGRPSESGLIADAIAAYDFAAAHYPAERIAAWGESLGSAVAVALAVERPVARLVLESAFTSIADVGAAHYWFAPVRWLVKDAFHSDRRIGRIRAPILMVHGARDIVVPIAFAERLFARAPPQTRFVRLPEAGHNDHDAHGIVALVQAFLGGRSGSSDP